MKGITVRQGSKVKENTLMICSTVMKRSAMKKLKTVMKKEAKEKRPAWKEEKGTSALDILALASEHVAREP